MGCVKDTGRDTVHSRHELGGDTHAPRQMVPDRFLEHVAENELVRIDILEKSAYRRIEGSAPSIRLSISSAVYLSGMAAITQPHERSQAVDSRLPQHPPHRAVAFLGNAMTHPEQRCHKSSPAASSSTLPHSRPWSHRRNPSPRQRARPRIWGS